MSSYLFRRSSNKEQLTGPNPKAYVRGLLRTSAKVPLESSPPLRFSLFSPMNFKASLHGAAAHHTTRYLHRIDWLPFRQARWAMSWWVGGLTVVGFNDAGFKNTFDSSSYIFFPHVFFLLLTSFPPFSVSSFSAVISSSLVKIVSFSAFFFVLLSHFFILYFNFVLSNIFQEIRISLFCFPATLRLPLTSSPLSPPSSFFSFSSNSFYLFLSLLPFCHKQRFDQSHKNEPKGGQDASLLLALMSVYSNESYFSWYLASSEGSRSEVRCGRGYLDALSVDVAKFGPNP